ncbi:MAG: hypothetical protein NT007_17485 [Candidatus Kapabacteria bacterium]|nr:hypothetical protein [Candidatus Kapabacteria bacterium]
MYATGYLSAGGAIVTRPDSAKEFQISDYLGNVRSIVRFHRGQTEDTINISSFDYKPFGDELSTTTGTNPRLGFIGQERDGESRYFQLGWRQYDPITGRFLSPDPFFEIYRDLSPYSYAGNSPLIAKDPSGLTVQYTIDFMIQLSILSMESAENWIALCLGSEILMKLMHGAGGSKDEQGAGYTPAPRTGEDADGKNGKPDEKMILTPEQKNEVEKHVKVNACGSCPEEQKAAEDAFWCTFWAENSTMTKGAYDNLTNNQYKIELMAPNEFKTKATSEGYPNALGLTDYDGKTSYFSSDIVSSNNNFNINGGYQGQRLNFSTLVFHELGHQWAYQNVGTNEYNSWCYDYKEIWAIDFTNQNYLRPNELPEQAYNQTGWMEGGSGVFFFIIMSVSPVPLYSSLTDQANCFKNYRNFFRGTNPWEDPYYKGK